MILPRYYISFDAWFHAECNDMNSVDISLFYWLSCPVVMPPPPVWITQCRLEHWTTLELVHDPLYGFMVLWLYNGSLWCSDCCTRIALCSKAIKRKYLCSEVLWKGWCSRFLFYTVVPQKLFSSWHTHGIFFFWPSSSFRVELTWQFVSFEDHLLDIYHRWKDIFTVPKKVTLSKLLQIIAWFTQAFISIVSFLPSCLFQWLWVIMWIKGT